MKEGDKNNLHFDKKDAKQYNPSDHPALWNKIISFLQAEPSPNSPWPSRLIPTIYQTLLMHPHYS